MNSKLKKKTWKTWIDSEGEEEIDIEDEAEVTMEGDKRRMDEGKRMIWTKVCMDKLKATIQQRIII